MQKIGDLIQKLHKVIEKNNQAMEKQARVIGEHLAAKESSAISGTPLNSAFLKTEELTNQAEQTVEAIQKITELSTELIEIDKETGEIDVQLHEKEREIETHHEAVGEAVWNAVKNSPDVMNQIDDSVQKLRTITAEIHALENQIEESETAGKNKELLTRVVETGKRFYFDGLMRTKKALLSREIRQLGRRTCESDEQIIIEDEIYNQTIAPVLSSINAIQALRESRQQLLRRKQESQEQRNSLGVVGSVQRSVAAMERNLQDAREKIGTIHLELGSLLLQLDEADMENISDSEIAAGRQSVSDLQKKNLECEEQIKKLETAAAIQEFKEKMDAVNQRIDRLNLDIKQRKEQVVSLRKELSGMEKDEKQLADSLGSEDALFETVATILQKNE